MSRKSFTVSWIHATVAGAVISLALGGCGKQDEAQTSADSGGPEQVTVKIGHAAPLTGSIAHLGKDNENGVRLAVDEANARGLVIGGKKVVFEMLSEDDEGKPDMGPIIAQKFADAKVAGVVGHLNSGVTIPASAVYHQYGIPMISGSATNPQLTEQGFPEIFRTVGRDDQQGPAVANFLMSEDKPRVVAVIDDATSYGEGLANEVEKTFKEAGVKVLPREKGTDKQTDWNAVLTKLRGEKPDAIFFGGMDAAAGPLLKQGRELGIKAVFAFGDGACSDKMTELAGAAAEGMICSQAGIPAQAASQSFLEAYRAKFNTDPIIYAPFTYDAANVLITAMQKADSVDPAKYLPLIKQLTYEGASGKIQFDDKGDRKDAEMTIFMMKDGKIAPVAIIKAGKTIKFEDFMKGATAEASTVQTTEPATEQK
ncbi:MAG: ABC transporter substrate-binding protein [Betaproteobacteria bacterium]|nr:ABC transporter substrate-binding protein [Betaproteobacteria bacterium]